MKRKKLTSRRNLIIIAAVAAVLLLVVTFVAAQSRKTQPATVTPQPTAATPVPSPGAPDNPGDQAKSQISTQTSTPAASPTATPPPGAPSINIGGFTVAPRSGGQIHVASQLAGASSGSCSLTLVSPSGAQSKTVSGQIDYSGTYYFCSFDTISGVTETGAWKASLSATSGDKTSNTASTSFEVGG